MQNRRFQNNEETAISSSYLGPPVIARERRNEVMRKKIRKVGIVQGSTGYA
jgi:hypothetical protein